MSGGDDDRLNPIPVALIGAGVAWLAISLVQRSAAGGGELGPGHYPVYEGYDEDDGFWTRVKARAGAYGRAARRRLAEVRQGEMLVAGAVGLAAGIAIGVSLPTAPDARKRLGKAGEQVAGAAKARLDAARAAAERAYERIRTEAGRVTH